ncbi:MAG: glycoside hydrolase family 55 protein, partial [bacterium]|nr:glycoside hydrolase family 55 protein [bacterium]
MRTPHAILLMLLSLFSLASCATITISTDRPWGDGDSERVPASTHAQVSALWGQNGELFESGGRLPDFSYAGYRFGEASIPTYRTVASVEDYGANGRDQRDDTDAFVRALSSVQSGTIEIPEGQYFISGVVEISKPNLVLKGAGSDKTIITVTNTLDDVEPLTARTGSGKPVSRYSWSGGFFSVRGKPVGRKRFEIIRDARRGDRQVFVSNPAKFSPGDDVQIEMQGDPQGTLLSHLYSGQPGDTKNLKNNFTVRLYARVNSVNGQAVTL